MSTSIGTRGSEITLALFHPERGFFTAGRGCHGRRASCRRGGFRTSRVEVSGLASTFSSSAAGAGCKEVVAVVDSFDSFLGLFALYRPRTIAFSHLLEFGFSESVARGGVGYGAERVGIDHWLVLIIVLLAGFSDLGTFQRFRIRGLSFE